MKPIRITIFEDQPEALLVFVPSGSTVSIPEISSPFNKAEIMTEAAKKGLTFRVSSEPYAGRWNNAIRRRIKDAKAERRQDTLLQMEAAILRDSESEDTLLQDRAKLIERKIEAEEQYREAKVQLDAIRESVFKRGVYADPEVYKGLVERLAVLRKEILGLQGQLGVIKKSITEKRRQTASSVCERFVKLAKAALSQEQFEEILGCAKQPDEEPL